MQNRPINAFTIDLEDWFQGLTSTNPLVEQWPMFESRVEGATKLLLGLLKEHDVQATFFVLGYVADRYPDLLQTIVDQGHEIGVHGYYHRFIFKMSPEEFAQELDKAIEAIHRATGILPLGHRAPYFSLNASTPWAFDIMASRGIHYDSSVFPTRNMLYGYPGAPRFPYKVEGLEILEYPLTTAQFAGKILPIAGGFYNRVLPYPVIKYGIKQVNDQKMPAILYVHPWELDTGQQYSQVTLRERVTHYFGRAALANKLHKLFTDFQFGPLRDLLPLGIDSQNQKAEQLVVPS